MAEYIDRKEFIRIQCSECDGNCESFDKCADCDADCRCEFIKDLAAIPAADVAPVVRAHWVEWDDGEGDTFECSACGEVWTLNAGNPIENNMHYCPNCGAKMDESEGG